VPLESSSWTKKKTKHISEITKKVLQAGPGIVKHEPHWLGVFSDNGVSRGLERAQLVIPVLTVFWVSFFLINCELSQAQLQQKQG